MTEPTLIEVPTELAVERKALLQELVRVNRRIAKTHVRMLQIREKVRKILRSQRRAA